jgi:23S rRNA (guanosine2251-2'-O)-methyltransferase
LEKIPGRNPVIEALKAGRRIDKVLVATGADVANLIALARARGVPVEEVDRRYLDGLVKEKHQGVVALAEAVAYSDISELHEVASGRHEPPLFVALDSIQDPQNLGSILRSVDALGGHGVILPERRSAGLSGAVSRASAGAVEYVKVAQVTNLARTLDALKEQGLWVIGLDGAGRDTIWDVDFKAPSVIVVGGEGKGLGRLVKEKCDIVCRIPMLGQVSSLNAGIAAALALYEARRQRTGLDSILVDRYN